MTSFDSLSSKLLDVKYILVAVDVNLCFLVLSTFSFQFSVPRESFVISQF